MAYKNECVSNHVIGNHSISLIRKKRADITLYCIVFTKKKRTKQKCIFSHTLVRHISIHLMASRASIRIATHHTFNNKWMLSFDGTVKVLYVNQEEEFE